MAEFVEKRCEDMIPSLEQMERIKLFDKNEIREIAKKRKQLEYKIQRHTKCKEDFLRYIQYEMDLLKLVKQRREKFGITYKKADIDYSIANKINSLYRQAILRFQDDLRFWLAYMKFCKQLRFHSNMSRLLSEMLQIHQDKPKCWHIAARWEIEETKNIQNARKFLLRGLHIHPNSQLLFTDLFKLVLDEVNSNEKKEQNDKSLDETSAQNADDNLPIKRALIIYHQASQSIKNVDFIIELLNIAKEYKNTEKLQHKIISDMIQGYTNQPQMWNVMARRELEGLTYDFDEENCSMNIDSAETISLRDRISGSNEIFLTAVKKIKSEKMWSFYIDFLLEINEDLSTLPNYKRKLLKNALMQAHNAKKLNEKYYLYWVGMLRSDTKDKNIDKLYNVLTMATDALPTSVALWTAKLKYLINSDQDELIELEFQKAIKILKGKALPLWRMKLVYLQAKNPSKVEEVFQAAMKEESEVTQDIKPAYVEWLVLTKGIHIARQKYSELNLQPPLCLELHKKMAALELIQPQICKLSARRPYEVAVLQFGKSNTSIWMDYIMFEMKYGDPLKISEIHRRAVKALEPILADAFIAEFSLINANPDAIANISSN